MVLALSPAKYGQLLSQTMPKRIETDDELDHFVEAMEKLSRAIAHGAASPDLTPIFGARSIASLALNVKRELSKAHIRKLAEFFQVSPAVFLA